MTDKQPVGNSGSETSNKRVFMNKERVAARKNRAETAASPQPSAEAGASSWPAAEAVFALTVSYVGTTYAGFARQSGQRTIQGELERALATLYHREVLTVGAGRTDAGVHALGQVVSYELSRAEADVRSHTKLAASLNALTPESIVVRSVAEKPAGFSARFSATAREYRYRLYPSAVPPLFLAPYVWWIPTGGLAGPLQVPALKEAAHLLEGEHDFKSFCVAKSAELGPTQRYVEKVLVFGAQHLGEQCLMIEVTGNAFLHSMVRVMVGTLMEVALGKRPPEWVAGVLAACDRRAAGPTAPAQGLTLWRVRYD